MVKCCLIWAASSVFFTGFYFSFSFSISKIRANKLTTPTSFLVNYRHQFGLSFICFEGKRVGFSFTLVLVLQNTILIALKG